MNPADAARLDAQVEATFDDSVKFLAELVKHLDDGQHSHEQQDIRRSEVGMVVR